MKKTSLNFIQNTSEFISEHEVVLKFLVQFDSFYEHLDKTKLAPKVNNLIFIWSRENDAFFTHLKNKKDRAEISVNDRSVYWGNLVNQAIFLYTLIL